MKQVIVSFNFDPETELVTDVKCTVDGIEKKKKTTKKVKDLVIDENSNPILTLDTNKLIFNNNAVALMDLHYEDRIIIKYEKKNGFIFPVIGKDISFDEEGSGNKVTKTNTVAYRGNANTILAEYGTEFLFESYTTEGIWKLISSSGEKITESIETVIKKSEDIEADLIIESDENYVIDDFNFIIQ